MLQGRRIVFVLGNLELGGAERQALILAVGARPAVRIWLKTRSGAVPPAGCGAAWECAGTQSAKRVPNLFTERGNLFI